MKTSDLNNALKITKALSDRQRVRMLMLLRGRELCVCQIIAVIELAPSTISKHLSILASAGLVENRKEGRWAYYRLSGDSAGGITGSILRWIETSLERDDEIRKDAEKLEVVLKCDLETMCRQQRRC